MNTPSIPGSTPADARFGRKIARRVLVMLAAGSVAALLPATVASAAGTTAACGARSESKVFSPWGDTNNYFAMPNGGFESGTTDWWLSGGASVVNDNEPWKVGGSTHGKSLRIPAGAKAESRTICVGIGEDKVRLFVKNPKVAGAILHMTVKARNPQTGAVGETSIDVNADAWAKGWNPTIQFNIPQLLNGNGQQEMTFFFETRGTAATWNIDDVYVDPFRSY
ncbi:MAG: hypothetical protein AB7Q27_25550 [Acidimicrobiia bacterium]